MNIELKIPSLESFITAVQGNPVKMVAAIQRGINYSIVYVNQLARGPKLEQYVYGHSNPRYKRTGNLRNRWDITIGTLEASTGPLVSYGLFLHEGTRFIQPPRPFLSDALTDSLVPVGEFIATEVQANIAEIVKEVV